MDQWQIVIVANDYCLLQKGQWGGNSYLRQQQSQAVSEPAVEKSVLVLGYFPFLNSLNIFC